MKDKETRETDSRQSTSRGIINGTLREKLARTGPVGPRWERVFLDRAERSDMAVRQERARLLALSLTVGETP